MYVVATFQLLHRILGLFQSHLQESERLIHRNVALTPGVNGVPLLSMVSYTEHGIVEDEFPWKFKCAHITERGNEKP